MKKISENIKVEENRELLAVGTYLVATFEMPYKDLVTLLGEPTRGMSGDNKVLVEWHLLVNDEDIVTVYNWKDGENYQKEGLKKEELTDWHIGADDEDAAEIVKDYILKIVRCRKCGEVVDDTMNEVPRGEMTICGSCTA